MISNSTEFLSKSAIRSGNLFFEKQNYSDAILNFLQVISATSNQRDIVVAQEGLFKSYYFKGDFDKSIEYSNKVIQEGGNTVMGAENRAILFKGKSFLQKRISIRQRLSLKK